MKKYKITTHFNDKINIESYITSEQDFNDFKEKMISKITDSDKQFLTFWEDDKTITINKNNILFFIIESAKNESVEDNNRVKINHPFDLGSMF